MTLPSSAWLGLAYAISEAGLTVIKRSKGDAASRDRGSMALLWIVIIASIGVSMYVRAITPWADVDTLHRLRPVWLTGFVASLGLRWWAIAHLGRFFTVNVAIAADRLMSATTLEIRHIARRWAGLRTFAVDKTPVVGFDPKIEGFLWLAGQGGYGFQTAPALASVAAALTEGQGVPSRLQDLGLTEKTLSPARFFEVETA